jgi:hypothetical protein
MSWFGCKEGGAQELTSKSAISSWSSLRSPRSTDSSGRSSRCRGLGRANDILNLLNLLQTQRHSLDASVFSKFNLSVSLSHTLFWRNNAGVKKCGGEGSVFYQVS